MESEKVKEIKKALECCAKKNRLPCTTCIKSEETDVVLTCRSLLEDILTLINELESENERLLNKIWDKEDDLDNYYEENLKLKDRIAELEKENDEKHKRIMELEQDLIHADENVFYRECNVALREDKIKAEALKQFAERLKEKMSEGEYYGHKYKLAVFRDIDIDETLNEFLKGENNE